MQLNSSKDYLESYRQHINNIKNRIMNLQIKFEQSKQEIEFAFKNNQITREQYEQYSNAKILDTIDATYSKYALSKEDRLFLQKNAEFIDGEITIDLINPSFEQKLKKIEEIYHAIGILSYYMSFPLSERKQEYSAVVVPFMENEIASTKSEIEAIKAQCKDKYYMYPSYALLAQKVKKYEHNLQNFTQYLPDVTEDELNENIARFYDVDSTYYKWFEERKRKSQIHNLSFFNHHLSSLKESKNEASSLNSLVIRRHQIKEQESLLLYNLNLLLVEGIKICGYQDKPKKQSRIFNKKINLEEYYHLFESLISYSIFQQYLRTYFKELPQSIEGLFTSYVNKRYQNMLLPDITEFKIELFVDISSFINNIVADLVKEENELTEIIISKRKTENSLNDRLIAEGEEITRIIETNEHGQSITLGSSFTEEEEQKIYESLLLRLPSHLSKEEQRRLLYKRKI